jgi:RimJ/RimL family protein N-acetyltransferase/mRNA-degrading endonuclease toxin of MazEF toxin-antitoxin module
MNINIGDVWFVNFPFDEDDGRFKDSTAIVLGTNEKNGIKYYIVMRCTSNPKERTKYDYELKNPEQANLYSYGKIRCNKVSLITERHFRRKKGTISKSDMVEINKLYKEADKRGHIKYVSLEAFLSVDDSYPIQEDVKTKQVSDGEWEDIKTIYDSLSTAEKSYLGNRFINSPKTAYSKVYKKDNKPIAFVQGYDFGENEIIAEVAVSSEYRGQGFAKKGVNSLVSFARKNGYNRVVYLVKKQNKDSIALAKKLGFEKGKVEGDHIIYYKTTSKSIRENMGLATIGGIPAPSNVFITQYGPSPTFVSDGDIEGYAIHNDIITDKILTVSKNGKLVNKESSFLNGRKIRMYKYIGENTNGYAKILSSVNKNVYREFLYEALTNKKLLSDDQIICDECFEEVSPPKIFAEYGSEAQSIIDQYKQIIGEGVIKLPLMSKYDIQEASKLLRDNKNIQIFENMNGYFAENGFTHQRTAYYKNIKDIQIGVIV